jgi:heat shock protein HtpX
VSSQPLLVHNRIEKNHRSTIILLALVPLLLLPFAASLAVWLAPWVFVGMIAHRPIVESWLGTNLESWFGADPLWAELRLLLIAAGIVVTIMTVVTLLAASLYRYVILGTTDAKLLRPGQEPDLRRLVENLCIGAGVPPPRLYLSESVVPNAFATGRDPAHATLTLTRGLLTLLTPRELEGVVAHELAHIVNHDSRLNTAAAALIATLRLPIGIVTGAYRILREGHPWLGILFLVGFFGLLGQLAVAMVYFFLDAEVAHLPRWVIWRQLFVAVSPFFMLLGAPALGLFIRQAVSRQREYLADAEAVLLTRDPEGLALALTKIGAWRGPGRLSLGPSASHLCIVDPLRADSPWWERMFPCHPPIQDRVQLLARMGAGIDESVLQAAAEEGANAGRLAIVSAREVPAASESARARSISAGQPDAEASSGAIRSSSTPVYEKPDGWSKVLCQLPEHAAVTICGTEGNFLKVTTADRVVGYISQAARDHVIATRELTRPD